MTPRNQITGCLSCSFFLFSVFLACLQFHSLAMFCPCLSLSSLSVPPWTLLFIVLFLNTLQRVQNQSLFGTCCLRHLACVSCNSLSTCLREVFVCLFDCSQTFCAMLVFPLFSRRNIIKFLGWHPHTPLVAHLAWLEASTDTHKEMITTLNVVFINSQSHAMMLIRDYKTRPCCSSVLLYSDSGKLNVIHSSSHCLSPPVPV